MIDIAEEMSGLECKAAYWSAVLEEATSQGYPVDDLASKAQEIREKALRLAALHNGEKIYAVRLQYEQIRAEDEEEALLAAFRSDGDLVDKRVEVMVDPTGTIAPQGSSSTGQTGEDS